VAFVVALLLSGILKVVLTATNAARYIEDAPRAAALVVWLLALSAGLAEALRAPSRRPRR
jgi:hypothetical protein